MRSIWVGMALGVGLGTSGCTLVDPPPKITPATGFPADKAGADLRRAYGAMKSAFANANPAWEVVRISGDHSGWSIERGPTGIPLRREARAFMGLRSKTSGDRCQIVVAVFGEQNQGGSAWGDPYVREYGVRLRPTSLHKAGDLENPFPIACSLLQEGAAQ